MNSYSKVASVVGCLIIGCSVFCFQGCRATNPNVLSPAAQAAQPPVTTFWNRLGIPQARQRFRDNLVNRSGNRPDLEAKPRLLKIADPENLASENPLLKGAAEIKAEEDLAPQKVKALKYLRDVACGCEKDKVEAAILAALEDCTAEVRKEALCVVMASTKKQSTCSNQEKKKKKKFFKCKLCKGKGCKTCKFRGQTQQDCVECVPCQSCGACCGREVQKKLNEMAYEVDDNGCFKEPMSDLRNMAAKALALCPMLPPEPKDPTAPKTPPVPVEGDGGDDGLKTEGGGDGEEDKKSVLGDETTQRRMTPAINASYAPSITVRRNQMGQAPNPNMVLGQVTNVDVTTGQVSLNLERPYEFPVGYQFILIRPNGLQLDFKITKTAKGSLVAEPVTKVDLRNELIPGSGVWIGILGY